MQILAFFSNQKLVIKGNNSCQKQCFMEIALLNVKTYIYKRCLTFFILVIHAKTKKKAFTEVILHSVCEVKKFGQVTVE